MPPEVRVWSPLTRLGIHGFSKRKVATWVKLLVFVSSVIGELKTERELIYNAINESPISRAWAFEFTPPSSEPVEESYLSKVRECEIFVLIVGTSVSEAVIKEYQTAIEHNKPCLVFLKDVPRTPSAQAFVDQIREKWFQFTDLDQLKRVVAEALGDEIIKGYRKYHLLESRLPELRDYLSYVRGLRPPVFLTVEDFKARAERAVLTKTHSLGLVGREKQVADLIDAIQTTTPLHILHGEGGVGKTRLVIEIASMIESGWENWQVRFVRNDAESIETHCDELSATENILLIVDEVHRFPLSRQLREFLTNPSFATRVKLLLVTRTVFVDYVIDLYRPFGARQLTLDRLTNAEVDMLLDRLGIKDPSVKNSLITLVEGNPLVTQLGAHLVSKGQTVPSLTRNQVFSHFLQDIVTDLTREEAKLGPIYIEYLTILAALRSIELDNDALRERIRQTLAIGTIAEEHIIARLCDAGLTRKFWNVLAMNSEVLSDHLLIESFASGKPSYDFGKRIVEPFLEFKPKEILSSLAEAEVKGESREAGLLLVQKLDELYRIVDTEGNLARYNILSWLENVAYLRPEEILRITARIVDGSEIPPEQIKHRFWGKYEITHATVLEKAVEILDHCKYRAWRYVMIYLHKLALYKVTDPAFESLRRKALDSLKSLAKYEPRKLYAIQIDLLENIDKWLQQGPPAERELAMELLEPMLSMYLDYAEESHTERKKIIFHRGFLNPSDALRIIRERALNLLFSIYEQAESLSERLKVLKIIDKSVPHFQPNITIDVIKNKVFGSSSQRTLAMTDP